MSQPARYLSPGADIESIVDAPAPPIFAMSPCKRHAFVAEYALAPPLSLLARPFIGLAGMRLDAATGTTRRTSHVYSLGVMHLDGIQADDTSPPPITPVALPDDCVRLATISWSPCGRHIAVSYVNETGALALLIVVAATLEVRRPEVGALSDVLAGELRWMPGGDALLLATLPQNRGERPQRPAVPAGPRVQETRGRKVTTRTYPDLLRDEHDEALLDYFGQVQLVRYDLLQNTAHTLGAPGPITSASPAPSGKLLLVRRLLKPYSRAVPISSFGSEVEVWDAMSGEHLSAIATLPLSEEVPQQGVRTGPRHIGWQPLKPATLCWVEALDGGDPLCEVPHRERMMRWEAPFHGEPVEQLRLEERYRGAVWLDRADDVLIWQYHRTRRWLTGTRHDLSAAREPRVIFDRSAQDAYGDPGSPLMRQREDGSRVAFMDGDDIVFLIGAGASPQGDRPFMDRFDLSSGKSERLFESSEQGYETPHGFGPAREGEPTIVVRAESPRNPPNLFLSGLTTQRRTPLTDSPDPHPELTGVRRELLTYTREDGVPLSGTLYLPPGYVEGERLPLVVSAYPLEYNDASTAGQVRAAPHAFTRLAMTSPLMFLARGYAVLDRATMPVVGDVERMNETFVEQLAMSAQATVDAVVERGVADRERIVVMGHSYGAFMVASLLAHTRVFKAGIARSGAYNRTLTPFGFQGERRSLWEAPELYTRISPLFHADRIKAPLLLIHGEDDPNSGTYPMQSERLFQAIQGLGGTARLVLLPHEEHGYQARESVLHVLAEQFAWCE